MVLSLITETVLGHVKFKNKRTFATYSNGFLLPEEEKYTVMYTRKKETVANLLSQKVPT
jgi:hypothetical protein